jgi:hypothetical protein
MMNVCSGPIAVPETYQAAILLAIETGRQGESAAPAWGDPKSAKCTRFARKTGLGKPAPLELCEAEWALPA